MADHQPGAGERPYEIRRISIPGPWSRILNGNWRLQVVAMAKSVSGRDLRVMMDLVHNGYADEPAQGLPAAAAAGLSRLVGCDSICLFELSPGHWQGTGDGCVHDPGLSPVFWAHYWSCPPCS